MLSIKQISVDELIPYENNPRFNEHAVNSVANSIKEFGFKVPIVITKDKVIVAGHTRLLAAKKLELEKVPCIIADDLSEDQVKAFRLADNKVSELAEWDFEKLEMELAEINFDMTMFNFELEEETTSHEVKTKERDFENKEIDVDDLTSDLNCKCPRCGMEFNYEKNQL